MILESKKIKDFLKTLAGNVYLPVKSKGNWEWTAWGGQGYDPGYINTHMSIKDFLLPKNEELFSFRREDFTAPLKVAEVPEVTEEIILFGVRGCDAAAIEAVGKVFLKEKQDNYYDRNRERTAIITIGCTAADAACFCTSVGVGPRSSLGADVYLEPLEGGSYQVQALTPKGDGLLKKAGKVLTDGEGETAPVPDIDGPTVPENIAAKMFEQFESEKWEAIGQRCIGCGTCTFLCPACYCFDIVDEKRHDKGKRVRLWDACQFKRFTLHGSGHNPRNNQPHRIRQRVMHKFSYLPDTDHVFGCTGCGRCVRKCPVNLDIREAVKLLS